MLLINLWSKIMNLRIRLANYAGRPRVTDHSHPLDRNFRFWFPLNYEGYVNVKKNTQQRSKKTWIRIMKAIRAKHFCPCSRVCASIWIAFLLCVFLWFQHLLWLILVVLLKEKKKNVICQLWSVCIEKNLSLGLETARGHRPQAVLKTLGKFFLIQSSRQQITYILGYKNNMETSMVNSLVDIRTKVLNKSKIFSS